MAVRSARVATPARCHCRGQRLLDEVGLRLPAAPAVVPVGDGGPDTAPVPRPGQPGPRVPQPGPNRPARANPGGVPRTNRPSRGPGGPTGPRPTGPGRHRARGPVTAPKRRSPGTRPDLELPRHWTVDFEVLDGVNAGKVKLSSPQARGWHKVIRPFPDAVKEGITEARIYVAEQGHAVWRGSRTTLDVLTEPDDPTEPPPPKVADAEQLAERAERRRAISYAPDAVCRPDQASPETWTADPPEYVKGQLVRPWRSPNGRRWVADSVIGPLLEKRARLGLPLTYEEQCGEGRVPLVALG